MNMIRPAACLKSIAAAAILAAATASQAGTILSPTSVYNNTVGTYCCGGAATQMINQTGLSAGFTSGVTDFDTYIGGNPTHTNNDFDGWIGPAGGPFTGVLDFALGGSYSVERFAMWNTAAGSSANVQSFTLYVSDVADFSSSTDVGTFVNPQLGGTYPVTVFDTLDTTGQYLRLKINSYYGNGNVVEIGEVALDVTPGNHVPEPGALALVSLALLGLGASRKARK